MTSLAQLAEGAGLQILESKVTLPNFELPVLNGEIQDVPREFEPLFCDRSFGRPADLTALYITLPECENCRPGVRALDRLQQEFVQASSSNSEVNAPKLCFRIVVTDWPTPAEVSLEFKKSEVKSLPGFVWDPQGALSERLAAVAQPSFYLFDRAGDMLAYQNGPVEFSSPGFQVFWTRVMREFGTDEFVRSGSALGDVFKVERDNLSSQSVSFLNQGFLPFVWLVVVVSLCYSLVRFFLRLRKNFTGPQN